VGANLALEQARVALVNCRAGAHSRDRTRPHGLDALIRRLRPLFHALIPIKSMHLVSAHRGVSGPRPDDRVNLTQTAALTNTNWPIARAHRQVVVNLNTVLGSLGDRSDKLGKAVDSLADLVHDSKPATETQ